MRVAGRATAGMVLAVLAVGASACSDDSEDRASGVPSPTPPSAATTPPTATAPAAPPATPTPTVRPSRVPPPTRPEPQMPAAAGVTVVLGADGLTISSAAGDVGVPFGATVTSLTRALAQALGPGETRSLPECGQGPRRQVEYDGFRVLLDGTEFVGWTESGSAERDLMTADGLALQVTLAEVRQAQPDVRVSEGSLGPEFTSERGISGFLDGTRPQSRVTQLYAGETCFLR